MKKAIFTLFLGVITTLTFAQQAPVIQPIITDTAYATHLGAYVVSDNLKNSATFFWALLTSDGKQLLNGNYTMTSEQYAAWCAPSNPIACNLYPFFVIGNAYNITFAPSLTKKK